MQLRSYTAGAWREGSGDRVELFHAVTGEKVAALASGGPDFPMALAHAREQGGSALRRLTFHQRAAMLKELAKFLTERKEELYRLSEATGATRFDSWLDIDGGIGVLFTYASKGVRELPDRTFYIDGPPEILSKSGAFAGRHICVPLEGAAVHINAFNFPCWGMLEKLAPTLLAGLPAIVKPASISCFLAERLAELIVESGALPEGAFQLVCGRPDIADHLTGQDVVAFTGSASTANLLRSHPRIVSESVRLNVESDSLNFAMLGPDAKEGSEEFGLFIREVVREMTVKAGQKCTAIRRTLVPGDAIEAVIRSLTKELAAIRVGDPAAEGVQMGPLASCGQVTEVSNRVRELGEGAELVYTRGNGVEGAGAAKGAFFPISLFYCNRPLDSEAPHRVEAFGPVNTVMPYVRIDEAIELARRGRGSLAGSLFTADDTVAREVALGVAPYHGRLLLINRHSAKDSTGHGSPLPHLVHGGPGRAGGGEELGGIRGVLRYMQRTALEGSPTTLTRVCGSYIKGAETTEDRVHPFRKYFDEIEVGDSLLTRGRTVTEADITNFACLSGDYFYAHTDEIAARQSIFGRRVAHGYLILSAAAGLFVDPAPGPLLANYGLENLRFTRPVYIGDTIHVRLTCKEKSRRPTPEQSVPRGVVAWTVDVRNQNDETVATYTILTLVERRGA
ncbi:MAG: phenylacetic acid degradation bifunctional protein PaaZ [Terriglobia bacterium]